MLWGDITRLKSAPAMQTEVRPPNNPCHRVGTIPCYSSWQLTICGHAKLTSLALNAMIDELAYSLIGSSHGLFGLPLPLLPFS